MDGGGGKGEKEILRRVMMFWISKEMDGTDWHHESCMNRYGKCERDFHC